MKMDDTYNKQNTKMTKSLYFALPNYVDEAKNAFWPQVHQVFSACPLHLYVYAITHYTPRAYTYTLLTY